MPNDGGGIIINVCQKKTVKKIKKNKFNQVFKMRRYVIFIE